MHPKKNGDFAATPKTTTCDTKKSQTCDTWDTDCLSERTETNIQILIFPPLRNVTNQVKVSIILMKLCHKILSTLWTKRKQKTALGQSKHQRGRERGIKSFSPLMFVISAFIHGLVFLACKGGKDCLEGKNPPRKMSQYWRDQGLWHQSNFFAKLVRQAEIYSHILYRNIWFVHRLPIILGQQKIRHF